MAYTPAYNALFAKPLLNQLIAVIQRDQAAAIAIVNQSLAPISEFHKGPGLRTAFPWLTVGLDDLSFAEEALGTRRYRALVALTLDVGQFDQEWAEDNAQDYARMLDMVITSADLPPQNPGPGSSWEASLPITQETVPSGTTTPNASGTVKEVLVESHRYGLVTLDEIQTPVLRVTLNVKFMLEED